MNGFAAPERPERFADRRGGRSPRRRRRPWAVLALAGAALSAGLGGAATTASAAGGWGVVGRWQAAPQPPLGGVVAPVDLAVLPDGSFVVVDDVLRRAQRFDAAGGPVAGYGTADDGPAGLEAPLGAAVDAERSRLYVTDPLRRQALVFDLAGGLVARWSDFSQPESATVLRDGRLAVYDRSKSALAVRRPDGAAEADIPVQRALSFSAELPSGLATSGTGSLFFAAENPVANAANVLYEFSAAGEVVPPRTQLRWRIRDIAFDAAGEMFLLDWTNARVVSRLDRQRGEVGRSWPLAEHPVALAARRPDEVWLLVAASSARPAAVAVLEAGREVRRIVLPRPAAGWFGPPLRVQVDEAGRAIVVDELARAVRLAPPAGAGDVPFTLPGLQEVVPLSGDEVLVVRTRSSSTADDPDDADAPPAGRRRVVIERYGLRPGADPGLDLAARSRIVDETDVAAPDGRVIAAAAVDATGRGAWLLDIGRGELVHVGPGVGGTDVVTATALPADPPAAGYRDVAGLDGGRVGLLHPAARRLVVVDANGRVGGSVALEVDAAPRRVAALPDGRLAVLTLDDAVAILDADGRAQATVALPRPPGADEPPTDLATTPDGHIVVADRLGRAITRVGPSAAPWPSVYLPLGLNGGAGSAAAAAGGP